MLFDNIQDDLSKDFATSKVPWGGKKESFIHSPENKKQPTSHFIFLVRCLKGTCVAELWMTKVMLF